MEERMEDSSTSVKLYQMVEQKLSGVGETLPCTLSAMAAYSTEERGNIEYLHFMNLDNESFLEAIYMCAFNAVPPQEYLDLWREDMETLSRESFQKKFMNSFVQRVDFSSRHVRLRNCFCLDVPDFVPGILCKNRIRQQLYLRLKPLYLRLPDRTRKLLKRYLWKFFFAN